jgi:putative ABC transport system ATP-binding protein
MDETAILVSGLRFAWTPGGDPVLDIPELTVARGERVFLRGPSGSGKTTLLNLLGGVTVPQAGTIRIGATDLTALGGAARDRFRADHVGFIFQQFNLVPYLGLIDNVALPCRFSAARRARAEARGTSVEREAARLLERMRVDVAALGGRPVATLSVGQQQRVAAARALIGAPDVVIADEPTSSLDEDAGDAFLELVFAEVAEAGATLLFVSHDRRLAPAFDRDIALAAINRAGVA